MPNNCVMIGCTNREGKHGVKMYRIPMVRHSKGSHIRELTKRRQQLWLAAIHRKGFDGETAVRACHRVCSEHFLKGRPAHYTLDGDPDWVPSLNLGYGFPEWKPQQRYRTPKKRTRPGKVDLFTANPDVNEANLGNVTDATVEKQSSQMPTHSHPPNPSYSSASMDPSYPSASMDPSYSSASMDPSYSSASTDPSNPSNPPTEFKLEPSSDESVPKTRSPLWQTTTRSQTRYDPNAVDLPEVKPEVDLYPDMAETYPSAHYGVDMVPESELQSNPTYSSNLKNAEAESSKGTTKDVYSERTTSGHEELMGAHNPETFLDEASLHCPYAACEKTKRRLLQDLNHALSVEKELKARIECLHSVANVNLDLLKRCLDADKSPEVIGEFNKVCELVQTIMNVQIWDMKARLATHHTTQGSSLTMNSFQNQDYTTATTIDSNSLVKDTTKGGVSNPLANKIPTHDSYFDLKQIATDASVSLESTSSSTITTFSDGRNERNSTASDDNDSNGNNLIDYIDDIISKNSGVISEIKNDTIGRKKGYKPRKESFFDNVKPGRKVLNGGNNSKDSDEKEGMLCDLCGKWIIGRDWHYQVHMRYVHTGERPYECELCDKKFHNRATLGNHMSHSHSEERPHQCRECKRMFKSKANLQQHYQVHKETHRIYKCPDCNTKCKRIDSFRNHVRSKHREKVLPVIVDVNPAVSHASSSVSYASPGVSCASTDVSFYEQQYNQGYGQVGIA